MWFFSYLRWLHVGIPLSSQKRRVFCWYFRTNSQKVSHSTCRLCVYYACIQKRARKKAKSQSSSEHRERSQWLDVEGDNQNKDTFRDLSSFIRALRRHGARPNNLARTPGAAWGSSALTIVWRCSFSVQKPLSACYTVAALRFREEPWWLFETSQETITYMDIEKPDALFC